jgi:hypothetical protein
MDRLYWSYLTSVRGRSPNFQGYVLSLYDLNGLSEYAHNARFLWISRDTMNNAEAGKKEAHGVTPSDIGLAHNKECRHATCAYTRKLSLHDQVRTTHRSPNKHVLKAQAGFHSRADATTLIHHCPE